MADMQTLCRRRPDPRRRRFSARSRRCRQRRGTPPRRWARVGPPGHRPPRSGSGAVDGPAAAAARGSVSAFDRAGQGPQERAGSGAPCSIAGERASSAMGPMDCIPGDIRPAGAGRASSPCPGNGGSWAWRSRGPRGAAGGSPPTWLASARRPWPPQRCSGSCAGPACRAGGIAWGCSSTTVPGPVGCSPSGRGGSSPGRAGPAAACCPSPKPHPPRLARADGLTRGQRAPGESR